MYVLCISCMFPGYINKCFLTFQLKTYYKMEGQLLMQSKKVAPNAKLNNVTAQWDTEGGEWVWLIHMIDL